MKEDKEKYFRENTINHPFFKTQLHFYNFVNKVINDKKINHPLFSNHLNIKLLGWYIANSDLFKRNIIEIPIDKFTWEIKNYSEENNKLPVCDLLDIIIPELKGINSRKLRIKDCSNLKELCPYLNENKIFEELKSEKYYTEVFKELLMSFYEKPGVYFLYDLNKNLIYIGKSCNIYNRIQSSINERKAFYCKVLKVANEADANILEPYFIALLNPILNGDLKVLESSSFKIKHGFRFTKLTKIHN